MDNIIEIRRDRVLVEVDGQYIEKPIDTLEKQQEREKDFQKIRKMMEE